MGRNTNYTYSLVSRFETIPNTGRQSTTIPRGILLLLKISWRLFVSSFSAQIRAHDIDNEIENEPQFRKIDRRYRASSTSNEKVCVLPIHANQKLEFAVLFRFFFLPFCS